MAWRSSPRPPKLSLNHQLRLHLCLSRELKTQSKRTMKMMRRTCMLRVLLLVQLKKKTMDFRLKKANR